MSDYHALARTAAGLPIRPVPATAPGRLSLRAAQTIARIDQVLAAAAAGCPRPVPPRPTPAILACPLLLACPRTRNGRAR